MGDDLQTLVEEDVNDLLDTSEFHLDASDVSVEAVDGEDAVDAVVEVADGETFRHRISGEDVEATAMLTNTGIMFGVLSRLEEAVWEEVVEPELL